MDARELYDFLSQYNYPDESDYTAIYNAVIDYENATGDYSLEYLFEDIIDEYVVCDEIKRIMDDNDLYRLYYFLGDADLRNELFRIDGYGNLADIDSSDIKYLVDSIKEELIDKIDAEEESEEDYE